MQMRVCMGQCGGLEAQQQGKMCKVSRTWLLQVVAAVDLSGGRAWMRVRVGRWREGGRGGWIEWEYRINVEVESQADLSAMNEKYVWAKEIPSSRRSARHSVGTCFGGVAYGARVCGWEVGGGRV